ncbi:MAG TPA: hypothetical protein VHE30_19695 [Polyangiaceae bacterium]|nr:hypothetical protein [Polyangiaceae bacterium]
MTRAVLAVAVAGGLGGCTLHGEHRTMRIVDDGQTDAGTPADAGFGDAARPDADAGRGVDGSIRID